MSSPSARFFEKSSAGFSKMAMRLVRRSTISLPLPSLVGVVEVRHVGQLVGLGQRPEDLLVDLVADVALALERDHVGEAGARGIVIGAKGWPAYLSLTYFTNSRTRT